MNGNDFMSWVLRSPFHGMLSDGMMLITITGRKTGKIYTTPVGYYRENGCLWVITSRDRTWWKNLRGGAPVTLRIRGRDLQGVPETVAEDKSAIAAALTAHLKKVPSDARYYGVTFDEANHPRAEEVEKAAQAAVMVRIRLC